jgi:D-alanyl-D-alanine carboxypeptidase (penicillin-binding protein 5/6)
VVKAQEPSISSAAVVLVDGQTGVMLYGKNAWEKRSIASLTKTMTLLITAENVQAGRISLTDVVTADAGAQTLEGTELGVKKGQKYTVEELLYAAALISANDAAYMLAVYQAGSEDAFAEMMTKRAAELGLQNTSFADATGLKPSWEGNYSTAYDLAQLFRVAMQNPVFAKVVRTEKYYVKSLGIEIANSNPLLGQYPGTEGGKTGFTTPAGHSLVASASLDGWRLVTVVLGAANRETRFQETRGLLNYGFENLQLVIRKGEEVGQGIISGGARKGVPLVAGSPFKAHIPPGYEGPPLVTKLELDPAPKAPIDPGHPFGKLVFYRDDEPIGSITVVAKHGVGTSNVVTRIIGWVLSLFGSKP